MEELSPPVSTGRHRTGPLLYSFHKPSALVFGEDHEGTSLIYSVLWGLWSMLMTELPRESLETTPQCRGEVPRAPAHYTRS